MIGANFCLERTLFNLVAIPIDKPDFKILRPSSQHSLCSIDHRLLRRPSTSGLPAKPRQGDKRGRQRNHYSEQKRLKHPNPRQSNPDEIQLKTSPKRGFDPDQTTGACCRCAPLSRGPQPLTASPLPRTCERPRVWQLFDGFDVPTGRAMVRNQFQHSAKARHAADRRRAFAQAGAVIWQIAKLRQRSAHAERLWCNAKRTIQGSALRGFR